jgi:hypothetical protein
MMMKTRLVLGTAVAMVVSLMSATCAEDSADPPLNGTGGAAPTGGTPGATGGAKSGTTGGVATGASGGSMSGGVVGAGGSVGGATATGGSVSKGGNPATGGTSATGGSVSTGGAPAGGSGGGTAQGGSSGSPATGGSGGGAAGAMGPCDVYKAAGTPCVAAYSTIRRIVSTYTGPLYQVRSGSSAMNTGSGGETHDIGITADGFADAAAQDAVCKGTFCTVSLMYDQSGRGNNLPVAKRGRSDGGQFAAMDDFESKADAGPLKVGGHDVYSLYMAARQGYRMTKAGDGMPRGKEPQGIYMLADGTHYGDACCWDFGNVTPDPTQYHVMNTLFFGIAFWGQGAGNGPWFMADFEAGVWAGGSKSSDPGWGSLDTNAPPNEKNPALPVRFAIGFLKTGTDYALRMADLSTATSLTTAYEGPLPKDMDNQGAVVIGVGGDNSNNSWGTFYEGAIVAGYPTAAAEDAVMQNVKAIGYGR